MRQPPIRFAIALIVCGAVAATTSAAVPARTVRADLTVTKASVKATGTVFGAGYL